MCVDAQGRRLTSDRPIPECLGREQRVLSSTGATKRVIPPSLTPEERERQQAQAQQQAAERAKALEQRRRDRALLSRYPTPSAHDAERAKQLGHVDGVIATLRQRSQELQRQRTELDQEMEFYRANPAKAPAWLQRRLADNTTQQAAQQRLIDAQMTEKQRIHQRFDAELARLGELWAPAPVDGPNGVR